MSKPISLPNTAMPLNKHQKLSREQIEKRQEEKLKQASKMYEAQFLNEMVKAMRKTVMKSDLQKESYAEKIYKDQLFDNYVNSWSKQGGVGLGELIYNQMHDKVFAYKRAQQMNQGPKPIEPDKGNVYKLDDKPEVEKMYDLESPERVKKKGF